MPFADVLDRETAWLRVVGDQLPPLLATDGPFQIIQARQPRQPAGRKSGIYVLRQPGMSATVKRFAAQRSMITHRLRLKVLWPLTSGVGSAEDDQLAFEQAIDAIIARIQGPLGDKTHGGRFLSVAENPDNIDIDYDDPAAGITNGGVFTAHITYSADDTDYNN